MSKKVGVVGEADESLKSLPEGVRFVEDASIAQWGGYFVIEGGLLEALKGDMLNHGRFTIIHRVGRVDFRDDHGVFKLASPVIRRGEGGNGTIFGHTDLSVLYDPITGRVLHQSGNKGSAFSFETNMLCGPNYSNEMVADLLRSLAAKYIELKAGQASEVAVDGVGEEVRGVLGDDDRDVESVEAEEE